MQPRRIDQLDPDITILQSTDIIPIVPTGMVVANKISLGAIQAFFGANPLPGVETLYKIKVSLTAAQLQTAFSIPIDSGIPNPGATSYISVVSADIDYIFGTVAFTSNTISLITKTATDTQFDSFVIQSASSKFTKMFVDGGLFTNPLIPNQTLNIQTNADSVVGDGTINIYILYRIVNL